MCCLRRVQHHFNGTTCFGPEISIDLSHTSTARTNVRTGYAFSHICVFFVTCGAFEVTGVLVNENIRHSNCINVTLSVIGIVHAQDLTFYEQTCAAVRVCVCAAGHVCALSAGSHALQKGSTGRAPRLHCQGITENAETNSNRSRCAQHYCSITRRWHRSLSVCRNPT